MTYIIRLTCKPYAFGDLQNKTLADQWRLHRWNWRYLHSLVPYAGIPHHTILRIWAPFLSIMAVAFIIQLLGALHPDWGNWLDPSNVTRDLFRLSRCVLLVDISGRRQWQRVTRSSCTSQSFVDEDLNLKFKFQP
jgi:hypothetical protein